MNHSGERFVHGNHSQCYFSSAYPADSLERYGHDCTINCPPNNFDFCGSDPEGEFIKSIEIPLLTNSRRSRTNFDLRQIDELESVFKTIQYPNMCTRKALSVKLDLYESRVQYWFQNRRAKMRRRAKTVSAPGRRKKAETENANKAFQCAQKTHKEWDHSPTIQREHSNHGNSFFINSILSSKESTESAAKKRQIADIIHPENQSQVLISTTEASLSKTLERDTHKHSYNGGVSCTAMSSQPSDTRETSLKRLNYDDSISRIVNNRNPGVQRINCLETTTKRFWPNYWHITSVETPGSQCGIPERTSVCTPSATDNSFQVEEFSRSKKDDTNQFDSNVNNYDNNVLTEQEARSRRCRGIMERSPGCPDGSLANGGGELTCNFDRFRTTSICTLRSRAERHMQKFLPSVL